MREGNTLDFAVGHDLTADLFQQIVQGWRVEGYDLNKPANLNQIRGLLQELESAMGENEEGFGGGVRDIFLPRLFCLIFRLASSSAFFLLPGRSLCNFGGACCSPFFFSASTPFIPSSLAFYSVVFLAASVALSFFVGAETGWLRFIIPVYGWFRFPWPGILISSRQTTSLGPVLRKIFVF